MAAGRRRALVLQMLRFGAVGIGATLTHLATAWATHHGLGLSAFAANLAGFLVAFCVSYFGHFYWSFRLKEGHGRSLGRFLVVAVTGYALSNVVVWLVVHRWGQSFDLALLGILMVVPTTSYVLSRLWAFRS